MLENPASADTSASAPAARAAAARTASNEPIAVPSSYRRSPSRRSVCWHGARSEWSVPTAQTRPGRRPATQRRPRRTFRSAARPRLRRGGRPLSYRRHGHGGQRGRDHLPRAGRCRERSPGARPGCWSGTTAAGASPATTTAPPARVSSCGYGALPSGGAALHPDQTGSRAVAAVVAVVIAQVKRYGMVG
jgi:hypothetical protein